MYSKGCLKLIRLPSFVFLIYITLVIYIKEAQFTAIALAHRIQDISG